MRIFQQFPLGVADFGPPKKSFGFDDALSLGNSVLNAGLGLLGIGSQDNANEANIAMQRETNAQNYKMFQEQLQYNTDMWNKTNEYNDPSAQVARLQAAGLNPYLALDKAAAAGSASLGSTPSPGQAQIGAPIQPTVNTETVSQLSQLGSSAVQMYKDLISAKYSESEFIERIRNMHKSGKLSDAEYNKMRWDLHKDQSLFNVQREQLAAHTNLMNRQADLAIEQANVQEMTDKLLRYDYGIVQPQRLEQLKKNIALLDEQIKYYADEVRTHRMTASAASSSAMAALKGANLNARQWNYLKRYTLRKLDRESRSSIGQMFNDFMDYFLPNDYSYYDSDDHP